LSTKILDASVRQISLNNVAEQFFRLGAKMNGVTHNNGQENSTRNTPPPCEKIRDDGFHLFVMNQASQTQPAARKPPPAHKGPCSWRFVGIIPIATE
jgi:single-stranded DNA-binding protein